MIPYPSQEYALMSRQAIQAKLDCPRGSEENAKLIQKLKSHKMYRRWTHKAQGWSFLYPYYKSNPAINPSAFKDEGLVWQDKRMEYQL